MRHTDSTARRTRAALAPALVAVAAAACGGGSSGTSDAAATATTVAAAAAPTTTLPAPEAAPVLPVTFTDASGKQLTVTSVDRIIPVDGDLAEAVFALGLGDEVVATDLSATYPPEAAALPEIGYQRSLLTEPILAFSPTIVLATSTAQPTDVLDQLAAHVPVVMIDAPDELHGPGDKIRAVAQALGVPGRGEALARETDERIDAALATVPNPAPPLKVAALYLRGERVQQVFGPGSGMHVILEAAGVTDVGELLGVNDIQPISAEAFIREAPDVIIATTTGLESVGGVDGLFAMPALSQTPAAASRRVLAYEDQYLLGFGPRTGDLLAQLVADLYKKN